jgi:hypothetical protein
METKNIDASMVEFLLKGLKVIFKDPPTEPIIPLANLLLKMVKLELNIIMCDNIDLFNIECLTVINTVDAALHINYQTDEEYDRVGTAILDLSNQGIVYYNFITKGNQNV